MPAYRLWNTSPWDPILHSASSFSECWVFTVSLFGQAACDRLSWAALPQRNWQLLSMAALPSPSVWNSWHSPRLFLSDAFVNTYFIAGAAATAAPCIRLRKTCSRQHGIQSLSSFPGALSSAQSQCSSTGLPAAPAATNVFNFQRLTSH